MAIDLEVKQDFTVTTGLASQISNTVGELTITGAGPMAPGGVDTTSELLVDPVTVAAAPPLVTVAPAKFCPCKMKSALPAEDPDGKTVFVTTGVGFI